MDLLPAIDIRNGRVVRLSQGERARQTVYGDDPLSVADGFVAQGAKWIHLVDLDRAFGAGDNSLVIKAIAGQLATKVRLQLGGGLRSGDLIRAGLDLGFARVVIGTAAALDASFVPEMVGTLDAGRLAVAIDARNGWVALRGWTETSSRRAEDLARQVVHDGIETVIYTDIGRDGMLTGPDLAGAVALQPTGAKVVVSGGVSSTSDIRSACDAGLAGIIVGKALYEGRVNLAEALHAATC